MDKSPPRNSTPKLRWPPKMAIKSRRWMFCKMNKMCRWAFLRFLNIYEPRMQLRIKVIQFLASIVPMMSMIKRQCHSCYWYHYCYYHHFLSSLLLLFSWCAVLRNTPGLRDSVVMRVLSDFYWTAATGAGLFTSNSATQQRHAACRRHVHSAENEFRWQEYRSAINQIREISLMQWPEPAW